jgi:Na+/melibiose symporter-like transporter
LLGEYYYLFAQTHALMCTRAGYYAVFGMAFGLIGLDIILRFLLIEQKVARKYITPERNTQLQAKPPVYRSDVELGNLDPSIKLSTVDAAAVERQNAATNAQYTQHPETVKRRLPSVLILLGSRRLLAGLWACLVQAVLLTSFDATLPLFVRNTFGWSSVGAGLIFLAVVVPTFIAPLVGFLSDRYGPRWLAVAGFLLGAPVLVLLRYVTHNSLDQKVLLCALLALIGLTETLVFAPITAEITYVVEAKEEKQPGIFGSNGAMAQAYGLFNMACKRSRLHLFIIFD